jgi:hypothetical protein
MAVGVEALLEGVFVRRAYIRTIEIPMFVARSATASGMEDPPSPTCDMRARWASLKDGWSRRLVRKYVAPLPPARLYSAMMARTCPGSQTSVRWMGRPRMTGMSRPPSIPMACATGAP